MDVATAYDRNPRHEWERLARDAYHRLEYEVTWSYLRPQMPPQGRVLDAGGGPGRYTLALCRAGYDVVLVDISPGCIAEARRQMACEPPEVQAKLAEASVADIRDLSRLGRHTFDVVLCLGGPLTHLPEVAERRLAMRELAQAARPGAAVAVSAMGRLDALRRMLTLGPEQVRNTDLLEFARTGDTTVAGMPWHFFRAAELQELTEATGLVTDLIVGCEGLSASLPEATNRLAADEGLWPQWQELVAATAREPAVADMSGHILWVGHRPAR